MNTNLQQHIQNCYDALNRPDANQPVLLSRQNNIFSREWVNMKLRTLHIMNFTSPSHRKTIGRHVVELAGADAERALIKLSEIFSHSRKVITRR